ncbi:hypothetical protein QE177_11985 [Arsenophonus sp. aPb]|uniref:phage baseplate protein n=1 Tax=Arsenophonus sp. aPb TaxID=3041619 RepID=UPI0024684436|nr:hypothetical protein [Arsenophonus sp. aPb]WGL97899.1 hypothetical protein QE177_11985 [Arsenophonus sp. aPb]
MKKIGDVTTTADQNGEFTNGNVAAGIAPTILEADWFNSVQREILNVLLKAKIEQNPHVDNQLMQAIEVLAKGIASIDVKQETGDSITAVMSQKAVTNELNKKFNKDNVVQVIGDNTDKVMSQKAVTDELKKITTIDAIYPAGIAIFFAQNKNPNQLFPGTKWQYTGENKTIRLAKADGSDILKTGGADTIKLTEAQLPAHGHAFSGTTSSFDYGTKTTSTTGEHVHNYTNKSKSTRTSGDAWSAAAGENVNATTSASGNHAHTVTIGAHNHTVSGTTGKTGAASAITITNAFVTLMCWYRVS